MNNSLRRNANSTNNIESESRRYLAKKACNELRERYKTDELFHNMKAINEILSNEKSHIVCEFKERLIDEDPSEYVRRYYRITESTVRLPQILDFYDVYSKLYPNYNMLHEAKYFFENIHKKQRMLDDQNIDPSREDREEMKVFNSEIIEAINESFSNDNIYKDTEINFKNGDYKAKKNDKEDSIVSLEMLIGRIKYAEEAGSKKENENLILQESKLTVFRRAEKRKTTKKEIMFYDQMKKMDEIQNNNNENAIKNNNEIKIESQIYNTTQTHTQTQIINVNTTVANNRYSTLSPTKNTTTINNSPAIQKSVTLSNMNFTSTFDQKRRFTSTAMFLQRGKDKNEQLHKRNKLEKKIVKKIKPFLSQRNKTRSSLEMGINENTSKPLTKIHDIVYYNKPIKQIDAKHYSIKSDIANNIHIKFNNEVKERTRNIANVYQLMSLRNDSKSRELNFVMKTDRSSNGRLTLTTDNGLENAKEIKRNFGSIVFKTANNIKDMRYSKDKITIKKNNNKAAMSQTNFSQTPIIKKQIFNSSITNSIKNIMNITKLKDSIFKGNSKQLKINKESLRDNILKKKKV